MTTDDATFADEVYHILTATPNETGLSKEQGAPLTASIMQALQIQFRRVTSRGEDMSTWQFLTRLGCPASNDQFVAEIQERGMALDAVTHWL